MLAKKYSNRPKAADRANRLVRLKFAGNAGAGLAMLCLLRKFAGYARQAFAEGNAEFTLVLTDGIIPVGSGVMAGAIGGATTTGGVEGSLGIGDAAIDHALMQQRYGHGNQGGFLATV